ncbi:MAG: hypothetical protein II688_07600 [Lachnospiraceae bacterium]|nr:hypothetical protein [Lachnospiraceae bacterium]
MRSNKKMLAASMSALLAAGALTGCYTKVKPEDYANTVVATYGDEKVMLDEANYYVKMYQATNDAYFTYYSYFYGYKTIKDMYDSVADEKTGKTMWDNMKQNAMATLYQTYVLASHASEYGVSLSDEDNKKIDKNVKDFFEEGDKGITEAINISEDHLREVLKRNALAVRVHEYLVKDIDTTVNEEDYRHTLVSYIKVTEAEKKTEEETTAEGETSAETETTAAAEEKTVDLKAAAEKIKTEWEEELKEHDKYSDAANHVVESYKESTEVVTAFTDNTNYAKPTASDDGTVAESLQKYCWNELKTGDFGIYEDSSAKATYVVYCVNDNEESGKKTDIDKELDSRRTKMFEEKYPEIVKNSPSWNVKERIYSQIKYTEIEYETEEPTTTAEATTAGTESASETETESKAETETDTEAETAEEVTDPAAETVEETIEATAEEAPVSEEPVNEEPAPAV